MIDKYFRTAERLGKREDYWRAYVELLFDNVSLAGQRLLDVGGGNGLMSFYAAARRAEEVVCLEPGSAGSNPKMEGSFQILRTELPNAAVRLERGTFQELQSDRIPFDVVLIHHAINHLDERACAQLRRSAEARNTYHKLFEKLFKITAPGGLCRYS